MPPRARRRSTRPRRRDLRACRNSASRLGPAPQPEKGGRGRKSKSLENGGFSQQRLSQARAVLAYARASRP
jgi:hypothetical protein